MLNQWTSHSVSRTTLGCLDDRTYACVLPIDGSLEPFMGSRRLQTVFSLGITCST